MKLELEKSREQQQVSPMNGYRADNTDPLLQPQHRLDYSLSDAVPPPASMHLQTAADDMDEPIDEEDEEDDDEEEDEENEDEEDESSSVCSGLSDSSTQSLANSDSEDEDDDEEDEEKTENFEEDISQSNVVPLSTVLCYDDGQENHLNGNSYLMNSSSAEYYQLGNASAMPNSQNNQGSESYTHSFQDPVNSSNVTQFNMAAEQYTDFPNQSEEPYSTNQHYTLTNGTHATPLSSYAPDQEKEISTKNGFVEQPDNTNQFQNYLNNNKSNSQAPYSASCLTSEQPQQECSVNGHSDLTLLTNTSPNLPLADHCPEVAAV